MYKSWSQDEHRGNIWWVPANKPLADSRNLQEYSDVARSNIDRSLKGEVAAGVVAATYVALAITKIFAVGEILQDPLWLPVLAAFLAELGIGFALLLWPRQLWPWISGVALSCAFLVFSVFGPPIRSCFCLGEFAELGPKWRAVAACALGLVTALGWILTLSTPRKS